LTAVALLQSVLLSRVDLLGARPDLMFLVILTWAVARDVDEGLVWGFIGGLLIDLRSGGPLGATALALVVVAFLAGQPWGRGLGSQVVRLVLLALAGGLVYHLIVVLALAVVGHTVYWGFSLLHVAVPSVLLNTLLAPVVQPPMSWLGRRLRREGLTLG
jgi:rod shape-determining protein MreD